MIEKFEFFDITKQLKVRYFCMHLNQDAAYYWLANLITVAFQTLKSSWNLYKFTGKPEYVVEFSIMRGLRQRQAS